MAHQTIKADLHTAELLEELLSAGLVIILHKDEHGIYTGDAGRKKSAATTLEGVIEELTPFPRRKVCQRDDCEFAGQLRPLWTFGPDKDSADEHSGVCKACESKRVMAIGKKKRLNGADRGNQMGKAPG